MKILRTILTLSTSRIADLTATMVAQWWVAINPACLQIQLWQVKLRIKAPWVNSISLLNTPITLNH
jgi:hypothetical protein